MLKEERDLVAEFKAEQQPPEPALVRDKWWRWILGMLGATGVGVALPVILVSFSRGGEIHDFHPVALLLVGMMFCAPGVLVLGSVVFSMSLTGARRGELWKDVARRGVMTAMGLSMLNLPGWFCLLFVEGDSVERGVKVALLFIVAGASAGSWIAWQAWRAAHPDAPAVPQYSLKWLLILVFCWGGLMAVFAPR